MFKIRTILLLSLCSLGAFSQSRLDYYMIEAGRARMQEKFSSAMMLYRHCLEIDPNSAEALYQIGTLNYYLRQDSTGLVNLRQAVRLDSCNVSYLEALASLYLKNNNQADAVPLLEKISHLQPTRTDVLSNLAQYYSNANRLDDAIKVYDRWEVLEGKMPQLSYEKYTLYTQKGDSVNAFRELESLCKEYPSELSYRVRLGYQYQQHGNNEKAQEIYSQVRALEPHNTALEMAMLDYYEQNHQDSLYRQMRDSILYAPETGTPNRMSLMQSIIQRASRDSVGDKDVVAHFEKVLAVDSTNVDMMTLYAVYLEYRQLPKARICAVMQRLLKVEPDNEMATQWLLQYYADLKEYSKAEEICRRGTNYHPEVLSYHYFLALTLLERDAYDEAATVLQKGLQQRGEETSSNLTSDVFQALGDVYYKLKRMHEAYCAYDSALVYNDDNVLVLNNYAYFLSLERDSLDKAEQMSYRAIKAEPQNRTYLDTYAWILFTEGKYADAQKYMNQVVCPDSTESSLLRDEKTTSAILEHAADIAWMNGDQGRACYLWQLAVKRGDDDGTPALKKKASKRKYIKK